MGYWLTSLAGLQNSVRRVKASFALADQIEARFAKAKAQVDELTESLPARAFRGALVPQDPTDEPANVLLERIAGLNRRTRRNNEEANSLIDRFQIVSWWFPLTVLFISWIGFHLLVRRFRWERRIRCRPGVLDGSTPHS